MLLIPCRSPASCPLHEAPQWQVFLVTFFPSWSVSSQPVCSPSVSCHRAKVTLALNSACLSSDSGPVLGAGASMSTRPPQTEEGTGDESLLYSLGLVLRIGWDDVIQGLSVHGAGVEQIRRMTVSFSLRQNKGYSILLERQRWSLLVMVVLAVLY